MKASEVFQTVNNLSEATGMSKLDCFTIVREMNDTCTCKDCKRRDELFKKETENE